MLIVRKPTASTPRLSPLGYLMAMYGENHLRLARMFGHRRLEPGNYRSSVGDGLDLLLEIVANHPYTQELRLSYEMADPETGMPDPSAHLRCYHDARQLEVTHCYVGRRWQDVLGLHPEGPVLLGYRLRMNTFLGKWLEYLGEQGHSRFTLQRLPAAVAADGLPIAEKISEKT